jgi:capsular exopolysaccharide synthesis family protein
LDSNANKELTLRDLFAIVQRRRVLVGSIILAFVALAGIYCAVCTRRYQATAIIQMQKQSADAMGLDSLMSSAAGGAGDALNANIDLQTQANILQSDTLALRTVEELRMESTYDFKPHFSPIGLVMGLFSAGGGAADVPGAKLEDSPRRRQSALNTFGKNLSVKPVSGTRLIEIDYKNPDPKLAALVVNTLTRELSEYTFQTRYQATKSASKWLSDQMGDLRKSSEELQAKVVDLERQSGVYSLGGTDTQGREMAYSGVLDRLQQTTQALTAAEQNRILKGAIARAAESGDADMLSGLAGNGMGAAGSQSASNSLSLLQSLRQQEAAQKASLSEAEAKFGPKYPKLVEIRANLAGLQHSIKEEISRIRARAKSDYAVAAQAETSTRAQYDQSKQQADVLNNKAIDYAIAREEATSSRSLYNDLLKRLNEAGVLEGLQSSNITVVDPGRTPAKPVKPNVPVYMMVSLAAGVFFGCCAGFIVDTLDNKINDIADLDQQFGLSAIGVLPEVASGEGLLILDDPESTYVEALRAIRTAVLLSQSDTPPKVILVTSSLASEGKSTTAINLAISLAQMGKKTLIIDTDLRRGTLRRRFRLHSGNGLSDMLAGQCETPESHCVTDVANLLVITAGSKSPNPSELLASETMQNLLKQWRLEFDFIVLDSAPVLPVTDTVSLNPLVDVTLLLAKVGLTEKPQIARSYKMLTCGGKHYVGLVLNGLLARNSSYYGYYGYRDKAYPYKERDAA